MQLTLRSKNRASASNIFCTDSYRSGGAATLSAVSARSKVERSSSKYLHELMYDSRWNDATDYVNQNGRLASKYRRYPQFMNNKEDSFVLPIHVALTKADVTIEFIEALIFAYPNSLKKRESSQHKNCLHIAIKSRVPDNIILYLIRAYPEGGKLQDLMGRIPLHYSISNLRSLSLISTLIAVCPRSIRAQDKMGWSPLHVAADTLSSLDVIKLLSSESQETIFLTTMRGRTPLVVAKESDSKNKQEIVDFLQNAQKKLESLPVFKNFRNAEKNGKNIFAIMSEAYLA
jgi:hypothetical protein